MLKLVFPLVVAALTSLTARAQSAVPVRTLSAPDATSSDRFGTILNVRAVGDGRVLVNDGMRRQIVLLDATLGNRKVVIDSVTTGGQSYGPRATPIVPYLGDSTLFVDGASLSLILITPTGGIGRVISAPKPSDLRMLSSSAGGIDARGNLVYRAAEGKSPTKSADPNASLKVALTPDDSAPIVRANFESRTVDTLMRLKAANSQRVAVDVRNNSTTLTIFVNPLPTFDEWAVLADGSIAVVRAHDYHVDILRADGKMISTPKLPFDWKQLTDGDKQGLIDSARTARDRERVAINSAKPTAAGSAAAQGEVFVARAKSSDASASSAPQSATTMKFDYLKPAEMDDYYPPIRAGSAKADRDGNLWILPATSAQSRNGELIYDVVNSRAEMTQRVRIPPGRSVAGFGQNGVVYLMSKDADGWTLERTHILLK